MSPLSRRTKADCQQMAKRRGSVMVEFAVVLPLLLATIFGIIEFARLNRVRERAAKIRAQIRNRGTTNMAVDLIRDARDQ